MRVLFFSSIFPRPWNTTRGTYCLQACRALVELGHEVRVISPRGWRERTGTAPPIALPPDMKVEYPLYFYPPGVLQSEYDRFMGLCSLRSVRRVMAEHRPDCVLSYWAHPDGAVAARIARRARVRSGVIVGGSDVLVLARGPGRRRRSVVRALRANDAIITVGRQLADEVEALGIAPGKVHVVYQGVDRDLFSPGSAAEARRRLGISHPGKILVSIGSLIPIKGIDVLLHALSLPAVRQLEARLYLVGEGANRRELEALAERLGLREVVRFVGRVDPTGLADGTPFVATQVGGVREIATGTTCRLVPPEDPDALAEAIAASLLHPSGIPKADDLPTWRQSTLQLLDAVMKP
jgi:glycosyltransferase involved in cell wall biosynthesis